MADKLHPGQRPPGWRPPEGAAKKGGFRWWYAALAVVGVIVMASLTSEPAKQAAPVKVVADASGQAEDISAGMRATGGGDIFTFTIPAAASAPTIEAAARLRCEGRSFCQVYGWMDRSQQATAWPMLDRELAALSFRYAINRNTGYEETNWHCGSPGAKPDCVRGDAQ